MTLNNNEQTQRLCISLVDVNVVYALFFEPQKVGIMTVNGANDISIG